MEAGIGVEVVAGNTDERANLARFAETRYDALGACILSEWQARLPCKSE